MLSDFGRPVAGRLVALFPVLFGITLLVFLLNAIALGDPARAAMGQRADPEALERLRREYALDRPLPVQYARWIGRLMRGDLGRSFREQRPVRDVLAERAPATIRLALAATVISIVLGMGIGGLAAVRPGSALDHALMAVAVLRISTPVFLLGLMLSLVFAGTPQLVAAAGFGEGNWGHPLLPAPPLGRPLNRAAAPLTRAH